jgi:hypothetical protein
MDNLYFQSRNRLSSLKVSSTEQNKKSMFDICGCKYPICVCSTEVKKYFNQYAAPPEDILSREERLSCCSMCGKTDNLISVGTYSVCKQGKCGDRYRRYHFNTGPKQSLLFGVPYIWQSNFSTDIHYRRENCLPLPNQLDIHGRVVDLTCSFCGIQNPKVIAHPRVLKRYRNNTFCKNEHCFNSFVWMVDHIGYS